jgi:hypothetical protein
LINIEIKDHHNSKTIGLIPKQLHEPIALIAKVKGFESIDDYVIDVLKRELESLRKGGHAADDFGESIAKYLQNMIPPFDTAAATASSDDDDDKSIDQKEEDSSLEEDDEDEEDDEG